MKTITNLNINQLNIRTISELAVVKYDDKKCLSVKLSSEDFKRLKNIAFFNETAMSEIVRSFLEQFLEQYHKENVIDGEPGCQD
jgi:hypothetical protein